MIKKKQTVAGDAKAPEEQFSAGYDAPPQSALEEDAVHIGHQIPFHLQLTHSSRPGAMLLAVNSLIEVPLGFRYEAGQVFLRAHQLRRVGVQTRPHHLANRRRPLG